MVRDIIINALIALQPALLAALAWVGVQAAMYFKAHTKNILVQGAMLRVSDAAMTVVKETEQSVVADLVAASADGKVDDAEWAKVKINAVAKVKDNLGADALKLIKAALGLNDIGVINLISSKIEAAVHTVKTVNP